MAGQAGSVGAPAAVQRALHQFGDRWTLAVLAVLLERPCRFGEVQAALPGIAPNVLSGRLKALEAAGLVVATPYQQRPLRLRYEPTGRGRELGGVIRLLAAWGSDVAPPHPACGTPLQAVWWCPTCEVRADAPEEQVHRL